MERINKILLGLTVFFIATTFFLAVQCVSVQKEKNGLATLVSAQQGSAKVTSFLQMFVKQVIKSDKDVSFDTRLKLENAVRDLNDAQILEQWQKFINSANEVDAQQNVKNLLEVLVDKMNK